MPKLKPILCIIALCLALLTVQAQTKESQPGTGAVSGIVTLKGEPASGVTVMLQEQRSGPASALRAKSDEQGRFRITGVAAGRYTISALAPGYTSPADVGVGRPGQSLNVAEGEKVENIEIEIRRGGVITGRVTDSQGHPVIEETVNLHRFYGSGKPQDFYQYNANYEMYRTDDQGVYRIFGLPEGRYLVSVGREQRPGGVSITSSRMFYPRAYYPGAATESEAKVVEVSEGSEATDIDITLPEPKQTYDVYGRVVDADTGRPVSNVEVVVGGLTPDGRPSGVWSGSGERSRPNGEFRLMGVAPGRYALLIRPDIRNDRGLVSDPVIFDLSEGDATGIEVKVRQGSSISGVVVIEGTSDPQILSKLSQVNLHAYTISTGPNPPPPMGMRPVKVNADGSFHIRGMQPGKAQLSVIQTPLTRGLSVARIEHNGALASYGVDVGAGEHVTGVRVVLTYSALSIRGEVKIVGGALPPGFRLFARARRAEQAPQPSIGAEVDARGQFVIENAPPGEYEVTVTPIFIPGVQQFDPQTARLFFAATERVVVAGANPPPVVLVIDLSRREGNQ